MLVEFSILNWSFGKVGCVSGALRKLGLLGVFSTELEF